MAYTPWFVYLRSICLVYESMTWMSEFGADTAKPSVLYSHSLFIAALQRTRRRSFASLNGDQMVTWLEPHHDGRQSRCSTRAPIPDGGTERLREPARRKCGSVISR